MTCSAAEMTCDARYDPLQFLQPTDLTLQGAKLRCDAAVDGTDKTLRTRGDDEGSHKRRVAGREKQLLARPSVEFSSHVGR